MDTRLVLLLLSHFIAHAYSLFFSLIALFIIAAAFALIHDIMAPETIDVVDANFTVLMKIPRSSVLHYPTRRAPETDRGYRRLCRHFKASNPEFSCTKRHRCKFVHAILDGCDVQTFEIPITPAAPCDFCSLLQPSPQFVNVPVQGVSNTAAGTIQMASVPQVDHHCHIGTMAPQPQQTFAAQPTIVLIPFPTATSMPQQGTTYIITQQHPQLYV